MLLAATLPDSKVILFNSKDANHTVLTYATVFYINGIIHSHCIIGTVDMTTSNPVCGHITITSNHPLLVPVMP